ncbi:unnamed protein product [Cuscuta campestris]|uniref:Uncharacterized protein n=1 Tax=Cuscuta campestris TaxID=132261 RepID=A0A484L6K4_9ASTE|nr:unnamed protein product [Cuscuta campestris]
MSIGLCLGANSCNVNLVTKWAVDMNGPACDSLRLNHPETNVMNVPADTFLALLKEWQQLCASCMLITINCSPHPNLDMSTSDEEEEESNDDDDDDDDNGASAEHSTVYVKLVTGTAIAWSLSHIGLDLIESRSNGWMTQRQSVRNLHHEFLLLGSRRTLALGKNRARCHR